MPPIEHPAPSAIIRALAEREAIPLTGWETVTDRQQVAAGDRCIVLVTLTSGRREEQWLLDFTVAALTDDEIAVASGNPAAGATLYTSSGRELKFDGQRVALNATLLGPLRTDESRIERALDRVERQTVRLMVNGEFLALGLDQAAATILRLRDDSGKVGFGLRADQPFPADEAAANRAAFDAKGITAADERAIAAAVPALGEFLGIAAGTPGLRNILFKVVDIPWWALIRDLGGVSTNINLDGARLHALADEPGRYVIPLTVAINGKDALVAQLVVGRPQPPGTALAGITVITAGRPNGQGPRVVIELLATRARPAGSER